MSIGLLFWVLMVLWLVFGFYNYSNPIAGNWGWAMASPYRWLPGYRTAKINTR